MTLKIVMGCICILCGPQWAVAQIGNNPLPEVPIGEIPLRLSLFSSGLPVQREFVTPVFTQRVGPTDLAELPFLAASTGTKAFARRFDKC